jgi:hypothetical protein
MEREKIKNQNVEIQTDITEKFADTTKKRQPATDALV